MKNKILMLILSICFLIPGAFIFSACDGNGNPPQATGLELIVKNDTENPNKFSCYKDLQNGNKEAFTLDDVKVYAKYSDDSTKLLNKDDYSYTLMRWVDAANNWTIDSELDFLSSGETTNTTPGMYKIKFTTENLSQDLIVDIYKIKRTNIDITLNQYTNKDLNESRKVELSEGKDYYEVDFLYNHEHSDSKYFLSGQDMTPVNSADKLSSDDVWFSVIENKTDYFNAESKDGYIEMNKVASIGANSFASYADLLPGDYLVFGFYEGTPEYESGYSENYIKLKINPINIEPIFHVRSAASTTIASAVVSNGQLIDNYRDVHTKYQDVTIITSEGEFSATSTELSAVISLSVEESSNKFLMVSGFNGTEWTHQPIDDAYPQTIKVHVYKDAGKYYLLELKDDKWFKLGTSTEISANKVEFVEYYQVEEYKNSHYITVPIYVSVNSDNLQESSKRLVSGYANKDGVVRLDVSIYKEMFSFDDSTNESNLNVVYDISSSEPNYYSLESFINDTLGVTAGYECIFNIDYNKPTGSKPNGEYQVVVDLIDNPNICFVEFAGEEYDYRTATFLGHSYSWDYKVSAIIPNPTLNSNNLVGVNLYYPVHAEYSTELDSDVYKLSTYLDTSDINEYVDIFVYKQQAGDDSLTSAELMAKISANSTKVENDRFVNSIADAKGVYYIIVALKDEETSFWQIGATGTLTKPLCCTIEVKETISEELKKDQVVTIESHVINITGNPTVIEMADYVTVEEGLAFTGQCIGIVGDCEIGGDAYETIYSGAISGLDTAIELTHEPLTGDVICLRIHIEGNETYKTFETYVVLIFE